jgi:ParB family chromosome partitioning protein
MTEAQQHEASLIENLQREDLNPMEIAQAYQRMSDDLGYTQQEIAEKVGKDRASVANYSRLLKLPEEIQAMIRDDRLAMGHARALITLEDPALQIECARQVHKKNLSVRNVELMISKIKREPRRDTAPERAPDPDLLAVKEDLIRKLGTKVDISGNAEKGVVRIHYYSLEELNRIYEAIKGVVS